MGLIPFTIPAEITQVNFIWVVGSPASGKSSFIRELRTTLDRSAIVLIQGGDYQCLQALFELELRDSPDKKRFRPDPDCQFEVVDESAYDDAHRPMCQRYLPGAASKDGTVVALELARPRYEHIFLSYTIQSLMRCLVVHVVAPIDLCMRRNERRGGMLAEKRRRIEGSPGGRPLTDVYLFGEVDLHRVPESVMRRFYAKDAAEDRDRFSDQVRVLSSLPSRKYVCMYNDTDGYDRFAGRCRDVIDGEVIPFLVAGESYRDYFRRRRRELLTVSDSMESDGGSS